ncbi:MAG: hypothetical protein U0T82_10680 [Bacteroidales bacterium]
MNARNFILSILLPFAFIACEGDPDKEKTGDTLRYLNAIPGGCNVSEENNRKSVSYGESDTLIFSGNQDSLNIFVGVNYICCTPFAGEVSVSNDSILISLNDTCNNATSSCYCHCMCYYTWDFKFAGMEDKEYYYQVTLSGEWNGGTELIQEGIFNPSFDKP